MVRRTLGSRAAKGVFIKTEEGAKAEEEKRGRGRRRFLLFPSSPPLPLLIS
jgi:hypothetical protein